MRLLRIKGHGQQHTGAGAALGRPVRGPFTRRSRPESGIANPQRRPVQLVITRSAPAGGGRRPPPDSSFERPAVSGRMYPIKYCKERCKQFRAVWCASEATIRPMPRPCPGHGPDSKRGLVQFLSHSTRLHKARPINSAALTRRKAPLSGALQGSAWAVSSLISNK